MAKPDITTADCYELGTNDLIIYRNLPPGMAPLVHLLNPAEMVRVFLAVRRITLSRLVPVTIPHGGSVQVLDCYCDTVNGFLSDDLVYVNGVAGPTTFRDVTHTIVTLGVPQLSAPGALSITVRSADGKTTSSPLIFTVT